MEETLNKTPQEIDNMYDALKESIRHYISKILADNNATEDSPLECEIALTFGGYGLTSDFPQVTSLFEDNEGIIWVKRDDNNDYIELDDMYLDNQITIVHEL